MFVCIPLCTTAAHNIARGSSNNIPLSNLQTTSIAQMLSIGGEGPYRGDRDIIKLQVWARIYEKNNSALSPPLNIRLDVMFMIEYK